MEYSNYVDLLIEKSNSKENKDIYVLDTNFLLNALSSVKYAEKYIKALQTNKKKIFIPFIVWVEFIYNLDEVINSNINKFEHYKSIISKYKQETPNLFSIEDIKNKITSYFNIKNRLKDNSIGQKIVSEEIKEIIKNIENIENEDYFKEVNNKIIKEVSKLLDNSELVISKMDTYSEDTKKRIQKIKGLIDNKDIYLGPEYSKDRLDSLIDEAMKRSDDKKYPGISEEDLNKTENKYWKDLVISSKYGDIFLWLEILEFLKNNQDFTKLVLVSDDIEKEDWVLKNGETKTFFPNMKIEINAINSSISLEHLTSTEFVGRFSNVEKTELENDINLYKKDISRFDTIVVPANKNGFEQVFLGENRWYSVRISNERIPYIKYIAAYQTSPISAITHYAEVEDIVSSPYEDNKKMINFKEEAKELTECVKLGIDSLAMQSIRYTKFEKLFKTNNIDDLFSYDDD